MIEHDPRKKELATCREAQAICHIWWRSRVVVDYAIRKTFGGFVAMPFAAISNRKVTPPLLPSSSSNTVVWDDDKLFLASRGGHRSGPWTTARNNSSKLTLIAGCSSVVLLLILIIFGIHLVEERNLSRLCERQVKDTWREAYPKVKEEEEEDGDESAIVVAAVETDELLAAAAGLSTEQGRKQNSSSRRKKHKVLGVVGIQTGFDSGLRRKALRETWFPSTPEGILRCTIAITMTTTHHCHFFPILESLNFVAWNCRLLCSWSFFGNK